MKEAISNAFVFNLIIVFVIILIAFFVGSISYSKASKVKNRIVEVIEKEGEHSSEPENAYALGKEEIEQWLSSGSENGTGIGYRQNTNGGLVNNCPDIQVPKGFTAENITQTNDYEYCVYLITNCHNNEKERCDVYYRVITYMYFDVPIISDLVRIPTTGETMTFTKLNS